MRHALPLTFDKAVKAAAILSAFVVLTAICTNLRYHLQTDFVSFWAAAKLSLAGNPALAYDLEAHKAMELTAVAVNGTIPFPYPPTYMFAILPFGLLPYAMAHAVWVATTMSAYVAAANKLVPKAGLLAIAFPPVIICGIGGQNSFLLAAIFMLGMILLKSRPFIAGLILGLMIFKPHLGLLLPLALIAGREWRAFAGAAVSTLGVILLSTVAFGVSSWAGFIAMLPLAGQIAAEGLVSWNKMASVYASLRLLGTPEILAGAIHVTVALAASLIVWRVWQSSRDVRARAAVLGAATLTVSPYLFIYDQVLLVPALAYLWQRGGHEKRLGVLYTIAVISLAGNFFSATSTNLAPLLPIALLALIWRDSRAVARPSFTQAAFGADCLTPSST
jgi:Glycosyltransferase family 87